jgi:putative ABC transport system permease protein
LNLEQAGTDDGGATVLMLAASTMALSLVGLVAAAAFVVVAQRRQRQLGLLAAIGASDRHVSMVMLADGAIIGAVAAVVGTALGIAGWLLAAPAIESSADRRIDRLGLPWGLVGTVVVLAVGIAALAAWWPARTAARVSVTAALSGRPVPPRATRRSIVAAVVLLGAGVAGIYLAQPRSTDIRPLLLIAGLLAVVIGAVLAAPAAVRLLGGLARHLPFAPRLALRDLARYQARAAAALAAITLGLGIAVGVIGVAAAHANEGGPVNLSDRELLIRLGDPRTAPDPSLTTDQRAALDRSAATVAAALGGDEQAVPLDVVFAPNASGASPREPVVVGLQDDPHSIRFVANAYVATPELLARYGIDPASIGPTAEIVTGLDPRGLVLLDPSVRPDDAAAAPVAQHVALPPYGSAPSVLVTERAVAAHGWVAARAGWIVESSHPLSGGAIRATRQAAAAAGLTIEVRSADGGLPAVRTGAAIAGAVLAMAIIAIALGLIRGESSRDVRTLTATGASARTRRALTASTAAALAVLGVLLGTGAAYLALVAVYHSDLTQLLPVPLGQLIPLVVGLPVLAGAAGWLLAGREPRVIARQALE